MDAEDAAHVAMVHRSGAFSEVHMDFLRRTKSRGIEVIGERGTLEWRSRGKNPEWAEIRWESEGGEGEETLWEGRIERFDDMFAGQLAAVLEALEDPGGYQRGLDEAVEALKVALAVRAGDEGRAAGAGRPG